MKHPKHKSFVDKSIGAALSAIEVYNKPDFKYREETFSILITCRCWFPTNKLQTVTKAKKNNRKYLYL